MTVTFDFAGRTAVVNGTRVVLPVDGGLAI
jgi:hypothetical protein